MRQDRLEAPAEVAEVVSVLMHLHSLPIVLDLREHAVGTLLHRILDGLAGLGLGGETKARRLKGALAIMRCCSQGELRGQSGASQDRVQVLETDRPERTLRESTEEVMGTHKSDNVVFCCKASPELTQELAFRGL